METAGVRRAHQHTENALRTLRPRGGEGDPRNLAGHGEPARIPGCSARSTTTASTTPTTTTDASTTAPSASTGGRRAHRTASNAAPVPSRDAYYRRHGRPRLAPRQ